MKKKDFALVLIAKWNRSGDGPRSIVWSDGRPATFADLRTHWYNTRMTLPTETGTEMRFYPGLIADVRFDSGREAWTTDGLGVMPLTLQLTNPRASDRRIQAELAKLPIHYRATIHRLPGAEARSYRRNTLQGSARVHLYWVGGIDARHDWFILASSLQSAAQFHEFATGTKLRPLNNRLVIRGVDLPRLESGSPPCYASLDDLRKLGCKVVDCEPTTRAVEVGNRLYVEGYGTKCLIGSAKSATTRRWPVTRGYHRKDALPSNRPLQSSKIMANILDILRTLETPSRHDDFG